ncbi:MAG: hypothetical protein M1834_000509 [Cirrosporium novae-zelandiae]|nr:MAG: hypothetical protein M1834_000509 [Cirrosporium novae-zelandiae]
MAFKDDSPSSTAVRQAILALSSLKLYGQSRAIPFKTKALSALLKSMKHDIGIREGMQLVAASMLLCLYEIFDTTDSDSASTWTWYACGAKNIVKTVYASNKIYIGDPAILLDWVYYHDTLSKFSLRHWKQRTVAQSTCVSDYSIKSRQALSPNKELIIGIFGCSLEILDIISQVVDIVLDPANPSYFSDTHERTMKSLELRLINVRQVMEVHDGEQQTRSEKIAELYRIATLVYLKRAAQKHPSSSCEVRELIDNAMMLLSQLETCERPFPLFVIGCEARDDIQRSQIIDILSKTQQQRKVGNLISVQEMIEVAWIQDDLHTEQELDFTSKLTVAMSTNAILPTFI